MRARLKTALQIDAPLIPGLLPHAEEEESDLAGTVARILHADVERGFYVIEVARRDGSVAVVAGAGDAMTEGDRVAADGRWEAHPKWGRQFKAKFIRAAVPDSPEGIHAYIRRKHVKGVGEAVADRLLAHFGERLPEAVASPLAMIDAGVPERKAVAISDHFQLRTRFAKLLALLYAHKLGDAMARRIIERYGDETMGVVLKDPYRLAREVRGIGFRIADRIALSQGRPKDGPDRIKAALYHQMGEFARDGHCAAGRARLADGVSQLLVLPVGLVEEQIDAELKEGALVADEVEGRPVVYTKAVHECEIEVAQAIVRRCRPAEAPRNLAALVADAERKLGIELHEHQRDAVVAAALNPIAVVTGGPGMGKALLLDAKLLTPAGWSRMGDARVGQILTAPDGRPTRITGVYPQGVTDVYRVKFIDGRTADCCDGHLWKVWARTSLRGPDGRSKMRSRGWRVVPFREIRRWIDEGRAEVDRIAVPLVEPNAIEFPPRDLRIDPYLLGALLGDGALSEGGASLGTVDEHVLAAADACAVDRGAILRPGASGDDGMRRRLSTLVEGGSRLLREARRLGLAGHRSRERFIPEDYKNGSVEQRLGVLRGLLDADGTVEGKLRTIRYRTTSLRLAEDVEYVVRSLGGVATRRTRVAGRARKGEGRAGRPSHVVTIRHPVPESLFTLPGKLKLLEGAGRRDDRLRLRIVGYERLEPAETQCISVDHPDRLFVTDDFVVTHNTSSVQTFLEVMKVLDPQVRIFLTAPTGRAAQRLSESTGYDASTLHRVLEWAPEKRGFTRNAERPLDCDILCVDEASMADLWLMRDVLRALPESARLVFIGDADQLPSVGAGNVLHDMIRSGVVPTVRLTHVWRQGAGSAIATAAKQINGGNSPRCSKPARSSDMWGVYDEDPEVVIQKVRKLVAEAIPTLGWNPLRDIQVLTPGHDKETGTRRLNAELQQALNPVRPGEGAIRHKEREFRPRDRVIQVTNNYELEVFNGDIGNVVRVDPSGDEGGAVTVEFDGRVVSYGRSDLDQLQHAYAITIHKSQGSEFPVVICVVTTQHYVMLRRNLIYTGVSRAKKLCCIVGSPRAMGIAVRTDGGGRLTGLAQRIRAAAAAGGVGPARCVRASDLPPAPDDAELPDFASGAPPALPPFDDGELPSFGDADGAVGF